MHNLRRFLFTLGFCLLLTLGIGALTSHSQEAVPVAPPVTPVAKPNITVSNTAFPSNVPKPIKVEVALVTHVTQIEK